MLSTFCSHTWCPFGAVGMRFATVLARWTSGPCLSLTSRRRLVNGSGRHAGLYRAVRLSVDGLVAASAMAVRSSPHGTIDDRYIADPCLDQHEYSCRLRVPV
jgi:hypothetical protein